MFNETENLEAGAFDRKLEENGAETNAATWVDWTYYYESLPADRIKLAMKLEAERMARLVLREPQVDEREGGRRQRAPLPRRRRRRGRGQRAALQDGVQRAPLRLADHRLDAGHPGLHARGLRRVLPDVLRAQQRDRRRRGRRARARPARSRSATPTAPSPRRPCRPRTSSPSRRSSSRATLEIDKPTATEKLLVALQGPRPRRRRPRDADGPERGAVRRSRLAPLPRRSSSSGEIASDLRGWVSTFRDPGLFECYATARGGHTTQELQAVIDEVLATVCGPRS